MGHLKEILREIYQDPAAAKAKGKVAREHIVQKYSLEVLGAKLLAEIDRVEGILSSRAALAHVEL